MPRLRRVLALSPYLFVTVTSLLVAQTANTWLETRLRPLPAARASVVPSRREGSTPSVALEHLAALVGLTPHQALAVGAEPLDGPVRSALPYRLLGTLVNATDPDWSLASVQGPGATGVRTYMLHDRLEGDEVVAIERQRVILLHGERLEYLDGAGQGAPLAAVGSGIRAAGDNRFEVPRAELQRSLSNLVELSTQARILPAFKEGRAQGFAVSAIRPDSLYARLGLRDGDVITRVNGISLESPDTVLDLYSRLQSTSRFEVELERHGVRVTQSYTVQ